MFRVTFYKHEEGAENSAIDGIGNNFRDLTPAEVAGMTANGTVLVDKTILVDFETDLAPGDVDNFYLWQRDW